MLLRLSVVLLFGCLIRTSGQNDVSGVFFSFKGRKLALSSPMQRGQNPYFPRAQFDNAKLDTLSNWFKPEANYAEIIRQDDAQRPTVGVAIGFEFDEENGEYPYTPAKVVFQLKDFGWGGVEFSRRDTLNFTGVSNDVSDDLLFEIDGYENDTIWGRFSGLLLSGAGPMASVEEGHFKVKLYRLPQ